MAGETYDGRPILWRPQPKQAAFMRRSEDEALYGGAAGGGKSDALVIEALRQVEEKLGDRARFTTPLLHTPANAAKTVWMSRRAGLLYIKVYDNGELQLAEVIPAATDTDAAYFFERLDGCFPLKEYELRIAGDNPKAARKLLGKRFRQTTCE